MLKFNFKFTINVCRDLTHYFATDIEKCFAITIHFVVQSEVKLF